MPYATTADLIARHPADDLAEAASADRTVTGALLTRQIAGDDLSAESAGTRAALNAAEQTLLQALADASAEIDGYLSRYKPPLQSPPAALSTYCLDIATYRLYDLPAPGATRDDPRRVRYDAARLWLEMVAAGRIDLVEDDGPDADASGDVAYAAAPLVFTRDRLAGY